ncbi:MAG: phosphatase PAP2 family protein [Planctomycetia bacterium]|nr:phosphatase PAP2 family protein [Planctomycetia bacterium]
MRRAAGLAAALSHRYPRGAVLFVAFATLAALQRVSSSAHYPSDICFGAAVGCVGAALPLWLEHLAPRRQASAQGRRAAGI